MPNRRRNINRRRVVSNSRPKPLRINNSKDIQNLVKQGKRIVTNSNNISIGNSKVNSNPNGNQSYGMGGGYGGGITPMSACPPSCPPGMCCVPSYYSYGEIVNGLAVGSQTWHPASCGSCGGGSGGAPNRSR